MKWYSFFRSLSKECKNHKTVTLTLKSAHLLHYLKILVFHKKYAQDIEKPLNWHISTFKNCIMDGHTESNRKRNTCCIVFIDFFIVRIYVVFINCLPWNESMSSFLHFVLVEVHFCPRRLKIQRRIFSRDHREGRGV